MRISDWSSDVCSSDLSLSFIASSSHDPRSQRGHLPHGVFDDFQPMPAFDAAHRPAETDAHGLWRLDPDHERVRRDDPDAARAQVFGKAGARPRLGHLQPQKIGRASSRETVCQFWWISVAAVSLKKKKNT